MEAAQSTSRIGIPAELQVFHPCVSRWFGEEMGEATGAQSQAWPLIASGRNVLVTAPTGSGKTLAAFLACINRLVEESLRYGGLADQTRVLYVSPLKALSNDIEKNLKAPLEGIGRMLLESALPVHEITTAVRTGDTSAWERQKINRKPPHILVSTPESLYILLTSQSGRKLLETVDTVIVDEIHALADNKRGPHLELSLQRLAHLVRPDFQRIGLSATIRDKQRICAMLDPGLNCLLVDTGSRRQRDLQLCLPESALSAVMSAEVWGQIYDKIAGLACAHRTTLVFVNTRRLAERLARHLAERMDANTVSTHHGSLSKAHRLDTETRLKNGQLRVLVATASLELGIDIGQVDLVCQVGSPASVSKLLQRVGRSGHGVGRVSRGRLFPTTLEELVECTALLDAAGSNRLDSLVCMDQPLDVLAQQIVAEASAGDRDMDELYECMRTAQGYRDLARDVFDQVLAMLAHGFTNRRGRRSAYLHLDMVNGVVRARRGARLTALTNGGAIPELFDYDVILLPENFRIGSVNEDFAFESMGGDIFQLGNSSYRIVKVETGRVLVEDARGQPPTIPFWFGEAPGRSKELSEAVSELMEFCEGLFSNESENSVEALQTRYRLDQHAAMQLYEYLFSAWTALSVLPTLKKVVFERFFDQNDDMHLVIHCGFGSRINRAWGLALRKRFCRKFNFELQAAALENSIILSLGATHSFPLEEVKGYLSASTVRDVVIQAMLDAPLFNTHWRWVCNIALAVPRYRGGKRLAPQIQRNNAEDLAAQVFPDQLACLENISGEREIPDHPLVNQAVQDCIHGVMDVRGLEQLLDAIHKGDIDLVFRDLSTPSVLAQAIINARPFAFLDDIPAEERRTLALQPSMYGRVPDIQEYGRIPEHAIRQVQQDNQPLIRNPDEFHDALCVYGLVELQDLPDPQQVEKLAAVLCEQGRAGCIRPGHGSEMYFAAEWAPVIEKVYSAHPVGEFRLYERMVNRPQSPEQARIELVRAQLELLSPVTSGQLSQRLELEPVQIETALVALEQEGFVIQGKYLADCKTHWCERRLLARMHRHALSQARESIQPVSEAVYMRFLLDWQHLTIESRGRGHDAVSAVLDKLQGFPVPLAHWQRLLSARIEGFDLQELETLFLSGQFLWHRPRGKASGGHRVAGLRRNTPVMVFRRENAGTLLGIAPAGTGLVLSTVAGHVYRIIETAGAAFYDEILEQSRLLPSQLESALSELADAGRVRCDSFRVLLRLVRGRPEKRKLARRIGASQPFTGRWTAIPQGEPEKRSLADEESRLAMACGILLKRYGVVFYAILERETGFPPWRQLRYMFKRMEARGEVIGGRFVSGVGGEQFALNQAVASLRACRSKPGGRAAQPLPANDPVNLSSVFALGERVTLKPGQAFRFEEDAFARVNPAAVAGL